jgi:glucose/arabinose dehydrogenase
MARGAHTLEISAAINGFESGRSQALIVSVNSLAMSGARSATIVTPPSEAGTPASSGTICLEMRSRECYQNQPLASVEADITGLTTAGDRVFVIESRSRVRVFQNDVLVEEPALTLDGAARITGLAPSPDFERSHVVFVAWSEPTRDGAETLNITRYRELRGILGEGATIVAGLPSSPDLAAPIAVDDQGLVYVALGDSSTGSAPTPAWSNSIVRFAADGSVPRTNPTASPVIARGYARPTGLVWNGETRELWLSGDDRGLPSPVSTLRIDFDSGRGWPWLPAPVDATHLGLPLKDAPLSVAVTAPGAGSQQVWLRLGNGIVQRAAHVSGQKILRFDATGLDRLGQVVAISQGSARELVLATESVSGGQSTIWRLTPIP